MTYWLDLFTVETWREFKSAGASVSGFRESRWGRVKKIRPDDQLLCYVVGLKRWVGVLRVADEPFFSAEPGSGKATSSPHGST